MSSLIKSKCYIGILGLGNRSTVFYLEQLNYLYNNKYGGYSTCPFKLLNTNFNDINPFLPNQFIHLKQSLLAYLKEIHTLKIDSLLIPNITLHETIDMLDLDGVQKTLIIHPIASTIELLKERGQKSVVLFGSLHSMKTSYISSQLHNHDIQTSLPSEEEMKFIDELRHKIFFNKESLEEVSRYKNLVNSYTRSKAVIIACTELSIVSLETNSNVFDMARIQINKAMVVC